MTEFVAHECKVTVAACSHGHQSDHLMKSHTPVHHRRLGFLVHGCIHFSIHQTESNGLVSHHRLIMTLRIADGLLVLTLVGELPPHLSHAPLVIGEFLYPFDPVVRHSHAHTEIEAHTTGLYRCGKSGHSADILGNRKGILVYLAGEDVGKGQICYRIFIHSLIEIVVISRKRLFKAMVPVKHAGHSVKTETVYMIFLHPELAVRKKEMLGFILSVIEAARAPCRMMSLPSVVEVKGLLAVKQAESLRLIVYGMGMDYVHDHCNTESVSVIYKRLELFRSTETRAEGEEVGHLIAEGTIVRMFLKGHYLEGVVSKICNLRKDILPEFFECADLFLLGSHAYMTFIDKRMGSLAGLSVFPLVRLRIPDLGTELFGDRILHGTGGISRYSLRSSSRPLNIQFV